MELLHNLQARMSKALKICFMSWVESMNECTKEDWNGRGAKPISRFKRSMLLVCNSWPTFVEYEIVVAWYIGDCTDLSGDLGRLPGLSVGMVRLSCRVLK